MREADLMFSRRRFLLTSLKASAGVAAGLIVGPEVFEILDRMGPRRLMVSVQREASLNELLKELYGNVYLALPYRGPMLRNIADADFTGRKWLFAMEKPTNVVERG